MVSADMPSTLPVLPLFLMFVRILAVLASAPVFNNRSMPAPAKIGFAALLALILLPVSPVANQNLAALPTDLFPFMLIVAQEILIGVLIGFVSNLVFMSVAMAAGVMGLQIGFRAANVFDPFLNNQSSALEQFYSLMTVAIFLIIDGHHWLLTALARTFETAPFGTFVLDSVTIEQLLRLTGESFVAAVQIALPIMGTLLLTDLGLGLIARAVPQIQVFFVGLPLKMGLGLLLLALTLALTVPVIRGMFSQMPVDLLNITR